MYQTIPPSGSVTEANDWPEYWTQWAQSIIPTLVARVMDSDCQDSLQYTLSVTGTGGATILASANGGSVQLNSGATAGGVGKGINLNGTTKAIVSNARTQKYAIISRVKVQTNPAGTGQLVLTNMTDEATADCALVVTGAAPTVYSTVVGGATAATVTTHANTAAVLAQVGDGTNVNWYVNGALIATVAQSGAANAAGRLQQQASNGNQNANTEIRIDKILVLTENPT